MTTPSKAQARMMPADTAAADEATSLAYWLAEQMGEHVDDQDGETLTETVQRYVSREWKPKTGVNAARPPVQPSTTLADALRAASEEIMHLPQLTAEGLLDLAYQADALERERDVAQAAVKIAKSERNEAQAQVERVRALAEAWINAQALNRASLARGELQARKTPDPQDFLAALEHS